LLLTTTYYSLLTTHYSLLTTYYYYYLQFQIKETSLATFKNGVPTQNGGSALARPLDVSFTIGIQFPVPFCTPVCYAVRFAASFGFYFRIGDDKDVTARDLLLVYQVCVV
jgi:hypothetical protein